MAEVGAYEDAEVIDTTGGDFTPSKPSGAQAILVDEAAGQNADVRLTTRGGTTLTIAAVPPGTIIPIHFTKVFQTGTTADRLVALYR